MKLLYVLLIAFPSLVYSQSWIQTNGPYGGDVRCMALNSSEHVFCWYAGWWCFSDPWMAEQIGQPSTTALPPGIYGPSPLHPAMLFLREQWVAVFFRSTDNGASWTAVNDGIEWPYVISLTTNADGDIFAGTVEGGGIYRSTDNGDHWTPVNNGLTNSWVTALAANSAGDLFAATWGSGVFLLRR